MNHLTQSVPIFLSQDPFQACTERSAHILYRFEEQFYNTNET